MSFHVDGQHGIVVRGPNESVAIQKKMPKSYCHVQKLIQDFTKGLWEQQLALQEWLYTLLSASFPHPSFFKSLKQIRIASLLLPAYRRILSPSASTPPCSPTYYCKYPVGKKSSQAAPSVLHGGWGQLRTMAPETVGGQVVLPTSAPGLTRQGRRNPVFLPLLLPWAELSPCAAWLKWDGSSPCPRDSGSSR